MTCALYSPREDEIAQGCVSYIVECSGRLNMV